MWAPSSVLRKPLGVEHCHPFFTDGTLRQSAGSLPRHTDTQTHAHVELALEPGDLLPEFITKP